MSDTFVADNINFSEPVLDFLADELKKSPTTKFAKNLGRVFVLEATFITVDPAGNALSDNEAYLEENAQPIAEAIGGGDFAAAFIESAEKTYLMQRVFDGRMHEQVSCSENLIQNIEQQLQNS
ncbi:MAG: hypothetical protein COB36_02270 [Alphaproteobacteria bacterium]|nr:MAG: hypothetical protein COB36_02270 [Alphaproteobacteria bacterium]